ncbi:MAG: hypothetical protein H6656_21165 [Ardenticatenaceae bacterium]|nr:hypothetical protein [Ardenticatenaceae bacterium]
MSLLDMVYAFLSDGQHGVMVGQPRPAEQSALATARCTPVAILPRGGPKWQRPSMSIASGGAKFSLQLAYVMNDMLFGSQRLPPRLAALTPWNCRTTALLPPKLASTDDFRDG